MNANTMKAEQRLFVTVQFTLYALKKVQPTLQIKYFRKIVSIFGFNLHNYQVKLHVHVKLTQK
jgi:hypothetical protein